MLAAFIFLLLSCLCNSYNILIPVSNCVKSESTLAFNIAYGLVQKGHKVTFISAYKPSKEHENLSVIWVPEALKAIENLTIDGSITDTATVYRLVADFYGKEYEAIWREKRMLDLWKRRKEFDLILTLSLYAEGNFPFLMDNDTPFALLCTPGFESLTLSRQGNWITPAVISSLLASYDENMSFWERSENLWSTIQFYYYTTKSIPAYTKPVTKVFPNIGDYSSYFDRVSLSLYNGHFAMDGLVPLLPTQIEIGALNAKKAGPLEKDLDEFVRGSGEAGIIYFSLGTLAKSSDISSEAKKMFLEAFRRLPQRVLWKYETSDLKLPPNVLVKKWMPQQDILGHPKTKVFISHCGTLSIQESQYHGVPILGMPIFFDQPRNGARIARKGQALILDWNTLTVDKIVDTMNKLVNDTSYKENMNAVSRAIRDQKETPLERAIWWLEYAIRNKGAPHLQYAGKRLSFFQYIMLDVLVFWTIIFGTVMFILYYVIQVFFLKRNNNVITKKSDIKKKKQS